VGRAILFVHLALSPLVFSRETLEAFEYNKIALLLAAAIVLGALAPRALALGPGRLRRDPLALGVVLLAASAIASTLASISPWTSLLGAHESYFGLTTLLGYALLFFTTRALCETVDDARRLLLAPAVAAAAAATYALVQVAGMDPIRYGRVADLGGFVRPFATLGHPNFLSAFLAMALPVVVYGLVRALGCRQRLVAAVLATVAVLAGVAVAVAVSRGAWLALAAAALILGAGALAAGHRRAAIAVGGAAAATVAVLGLLSLLLPRPTTGLVLAGLLQRVRQFGDSASRQHIWQAAWGIFRDHPLLGSGLDTFQIAFAGKRTVAYWNTEWNGSPTRAHNEALNLLATQGLLGGLAVLVLAAGLVLAGRQALRAGEDRLLVVALVAGITAFAVQDLFSFTVAGCGTLVVSQAALLSRLARPAGTPPAARDGLEGFAITLVVTVLLAAAAFAHNVSAEALLDEPARLGGGLLVLAALLVAAGAALAAEQHGRGPGLTPASPSRRGRAIVPSPYRGVGAAVSWLVAGVLLVAVVLRPLAAAWAAQQGVLLTATRPGEAVERLQRAVALDPVNELYWVKLGATAHAQARRASGADSRDRALQRAGAAFERARRLVPANAFNHANLGRVLADRAREGRVPPAEAFVHFDRALAMDPNNAYFYADAANAALTLGELHRARGYASRGSALYPRFGLLRAQLGYVALAERRPAEAIEPLRQALVDDWHGADQAQAIAASNLAAGYLQLGRPADAEAAARRALERVPALADARFNLARALEGLGRQAEAIAEYRRLLAEQPDYARAREALRVLGAS
jgi:O-antigen ligase/tetratricopeptide (TPR) repeat protein